MARWGNFVLKLALEGSLADFLRVEAAVVQRGLRAGIQQSTNDLKQTLRDQVTGAGMGRQLANTWRSAVYPKPGTKTFGPAGVVRSEAPDIVRAFDRGEVIKSSDGFYLAIPTDAAPERGRGGERLTPSNFPEERFGELRFVYRRGAPSLLVVDDVRIGRTGRAGRKLRGGARKKNGDYKKGITTVVMFVMVPQVRMPKRLNIGSALTRTNARIARNVVQAMKAEDRKNHDKR